MAYTKQNFEDGQVLEAEHLNHMEDGIKNAVQYTEQSLTDEQQAQARANIGAIKSWDEMEGKPFGTIARSGDILPESQTEYQADLGIAYASNNLVQVPDNGSTVIVFWDGVPYECVCFDDNGIGIGNLSLMGSGDDSGEPFLLYCPQDGNVVIVQDDTESHTIRIEGEWTETKTIDPQFVTGDAFVLWVNITGDYTNNKDWSIDKTHSELLAAYNAGRIIMAKVDCSDNIHIAHLVEFDVNTSFHFLTPAIISTASVNKRYMFKVSKDDSLTVTEYTTS